MRILDIIKYVPGVRPIGRRFRRVFSKCAQDGTQAGELSRLREIIRPDDPQYLVDIGANDGASISNSRALLQEGWHGILVEPSPGPFSKLSALYARNERVRCVNVACSDHVGVQDFFFGSDGQDGLMGTLCTDSNEWFKKARSNNAITVRVDTITNLLSSNQFPRDFGLLLIDAEGCDYECLLGLDFNRFRPRIIVTEEYRWNTQKHQLKYNLLNRNCYKLVNCVGCNSIWRTRS